MSEAKKIGRPTKPISDKDLMGICRLGASLEDAANFFECTPETIHKYIKNKFGTTFLRFRDEQLSHTKMDLVQSALRQAKEGNTALMIFCLKNIARWTDRIDISVQQPQKITLNYALKNSPHKELADPDTIDVTPEPTNEE